MMKIFRILCMGLIFTCSCLFIYGQEKETVVLIETNMGNMKAKLYNDTPIHRDHFIKLAKKGHYDGTLFYRVIKNFVIQGGSSDSRHVRPGQAIGYGEAIIIDAEIRPNHFHKKGALAAPRQPDRENFYKESDISQFYIVHGKKYSEEELDFVVKAKNNPIRNAIQKKHFTDEKRAVLKKLKEEKKVAEFREIAEKIKQDIDFDWSINPDKIEMTEEKEEAYLNQGGAHHLDKDYTVFGEVIEGFDVIDKIASLETDANNRPRKDVRIKVSILP